MVRTQNLYSFWYRQHVYDLREKERWLFDEVVNHVGIYGSKGAEGLSVFNACLVMSYIRTKRPCFIGVYYVLFFKVRIQATTWTNKPMQIYCQKNQITKKKIHCQTTFLLRLKCVKMVYCYQYQWWTLNLQGPMVHTCTMMAWPNGNIFCVTGPFCGEFTGHRWILRTKASARIGLDCICLTKTHVPKDILMVFHK